MSDEGPPDVDAGARSELRRMQDALRAFAEEREWGRFHSPRNLAMALSVEAGELLELFLWSRDDGPQPALPERRERLADEAADVLACLLNLCERAGIDLEAAFWAKLARNAERYPAAQTRGSMRKYDEYVGGERRGDGRSAHGIGDDDDAGRTRTEPGGPSRTTKGQTQESE